MNAKGGCVRFVEALSFCLGGLLMARAGWVRWIPQAQ